MTTEAIRKRNRLWAQRKRDRKRPAGATRCHLDGYQLVMETSGTGALVVRCEACERRRAHQCMDCGCQVRGRAWRCAVHRERALKKSERASGLRRAEEKNRQERERRRRDPEFRAKRNAKNRRWRERNVVRCKLYKRRPALEGRPGGWATREKYLAYQREYRERHRERRREQARAAYYRAHPERPRPTCQACGAALAYKGTGAPPKWCETHRPFPYRRKAAA